jgi:formiminoglutamase
MTLSEYLRAQCEQAQPVPIYRTEAEDRRIGDYLLDLGTEWESRNPTVALLGVPTDEGVRRNGGRVGAAAAPAAIRAALCSLTASWGSMLLPEDFAILDCGNVRTGSLSLEEIHRRQQEIVGALLDAGMTVIVFGGGHDVALPNGRALGTRSSKLGILNVDAHTDVRPRTTEGSHSGSPFRELIEDSSCPLVQLVEFGIQPFRVSAHHVHFVLTHGHTVWTLDQIRRQSLSAALDQVRALLRQCDGIHLSLDVDSVSSAFAPGVSAPSSDGFSPADVIAIIEQVAAMETCRLVDIVEVNPRYDRDGQTARLAAYFAAHVIWTVAHRTQCH